MSNLFSSHLAGDAGAPEPGVSGGLPLSEADGMPSLSGMFPSDAAAFLQSSKKASPALAGHLLRLLHDASPWRAMRMCIFLAWMSGRNLHLAMTHKAAAAVMLSCRHSFSGSMPVSDA